jgi:hypothetical protein
MKGGGAVAQNFAGKKMKKIMNFLMILYGSIIYCKGNENETTVRKIK